MSNDHIERPNDPQTSMTEANNPDAHDDEPSQNDDCPKCDDGTLYREPWLTCGTERAFRNGKTGGLACTKCDFAIRNGGHDPLDEDQVQCREDGCETAKPPVLLYDGRCGPCQRDHEYEQMAEEMEEANA